MATDQPRKQCMEGQHGSSLWMDLLAVGCGGAIGAISRHGLTRLMLTLTGGGHWGTLIANLLGCVLIGLLAGSVTSGWNFTDRGQLAIRTGFLGGLTTFSAFALESVAFASDQRWGLATIYTASNLFLGLLLAWLGILMGKAIMGA